MEGESDFEDTPLGNLGGHGTRTEPLSPGGVAAEDLEPRFAAVPLPLALLPFFEPLEFAPSCYVRYDPECWDLPEIQAALQTLREVEKGTEPKFERWRDWATGELEASFAAWRGFLKRGPKPDPTLDQELLRQFEQLSEAVKQKRGGTLALGVPAKDNKGTYWGAPTLFIPEERGVGEFPCSTEGVYQILARTFGLSVANVKNRVSQVLIRSGRRRLKASPRPRRRRS